MEWSFRDRWINKAAYIITLFIPYPVVVCDPIRQQLWQSVRCLSVVIIEPAFSCFEQVARKNYQKQHENLFRLVVQTEISDMTLLIQLVKLQTNACTETRICASYSFTFAPKMNRIPDCTRHISLVM